MRDQDGPEDPAQADTVYTIMPGFLAGPQWLQTLARNVVRKSTAAGRHAEFWVNSCRSTCLADRTGLDAAAAAGDYRVAVDYYFKGRAVDGKVFEGFKNWSQVQFLKAVDQGQTVRDWYAAIVQSLPDPEVRARKLLCGGQSFGGPITGIFAAWGFGENPREAANAGYQQCAGFFGVDTTLTSDIANMNGKPLLGTTVGALAGLVDQGTHAIAGLGILPDIDIGLLITPETFTMLSIAGLAAYFQPEQESELLKLLPHTANLDFTFNLALSRTYAQFLSHYPDVRSFRYTNEALLGALLDNNSGAIALLQQNIGSFGGGPVGGKDFPLPTQVNAIPVVGRAIAGFIAPGPDPKVGPTDPAALYTWRRYDATPGTLPDGTAYTSKEHEVTDIHELARELFEGPGSFYEAYTPTETLIGVFTGISLAARVPLGNFEDMLYPSGILQKPRGWVTAPDAGVYALVHDLSQPLIDWLNPGQPLIPDSAARVPHYAHADTTTAAERQNDGKPEGVSQFLTDFAIETVR